MPYGPAGWRPPPANPTRRAPLLPPNAGTFNPAPAPGPAPAPPAYSGPLTKDGQLSALLAVKEAIDRSGLGLPGWTAAKGAGGGFCSFAGVECDAAGDVVKIDLDNKSGAGGGTLPPASVLAGLRKLRTVWLGGLRLQGTLPRDWGTLRGLEDVRLANNELTGGVPPEWRAMGRLKTLYV